MLNDAQKAALLETVAHHIEDISRSEQGPRFAINALTAVTKTKDMDELPEALETVLDAADVLQSVLFLRRVLSHPCPELRSPFHPDQYPLCKEPAGILSLSALGDPSAPASVTRSDVTSAVKDLIDRSLAQLHVAQDDEQRAEAAREAQVMADLEAVAALPREQLLEHIFLLKQSLLEERLEKERAMRAQERLRAQLVQTRKTVTEREATMAVIRERIGRVLEDPTTLLAQGNQQQSAAAQAVATAIARSQRAMTPTFLSPRGGDANVAAQPPLPASAADAPGDAMQQIMLSAKKMVPAASMPPPPPPKHSGTPGTTSPTTTGQPQPKAAGGPALALPGGVGATGDNELLYVLGGMDGNTFLDSVETYNVSSNKWTSRARMLSKRSGLGTEGLGDGIVAVGGHSSKAYLSSVEYYDPHNDTWSPIAHMDTARYGVGTAVLDGTLYACGGSDGNEYLSSISIYHSGDNHWIPGPSMNVPRYGAGISSVSESNQILAIGGHDGSHYLDSVEALDPRDPEGWRLLAPMPNRCCGVGVAARDGLIYVVGGRGGSTLRNVVEVFDVRANAWRRLDSRMLSKRYGVSCAFAQKFLFAVGGHGGYLSFDTVECFDVQKQRWWGGLAKMSTRRKEAAVTAQFEVAEQQVCWLPPA